jgi:hypothetical protein
MMARATTSLLLLLAIISIAAPLVADIGCEDSCGPHCGDCAWCPHAADLLAADGAVTLPVTAVVSVTTASSPTTPPRASDHVPLLAS